MKDAFATLLLQDTFVIKSSLQLMLNTQLNTQINLSHLSSNFARGIHYTIVMLRLGRNELQMEELCDDIMIPSWSSQPDSPPLVSRALISKSSHYA